MARSTSPLRYPGGKTTLYPLVSSILRINKIERKHYVEPFAGGCGLALALLYEGHVSSIHINDVDPSIWALWHSVLCNTDEFIDMIMKMPITVDEWHRQREIHLQQDTSDPLSLGFSTFFLNRTNRSGIIKAAGVIGGLSQNGPYKIDCRFNRDDLTRRVKRVAKYRGRINLYCMDAIDFILETNKSLPSSTFFCIDPPYFKKGSWLYTSYYDESDHEILSSHILDLSNPWIITYDNMQKISDLYSSRRQFEFDISYSVETKRRGTELLIASKGLKIPPEIRSRLVNRPKYRAA